MVGMSSVGYDDENEGLRLEGTRSLPEEIKGMKRQRTEWAIRMKAEISRRQGRILTGEDHKLA